MFPAGATKSTLKLIEDPKYNDAFVSKNIPDALTSRVTPQTPPKFTGSDMGTRSPPLLSSFFITIFRR